MVFLQGTAIMHKNALGKSREERVRQVIDGNESLEEFSSYAPVDNAVLKLQGWHGQGAEICYLSSHNETEDVETDKFVLRKYGFPDGPVYYRQSHERYEDVAERVMPDILIEDDCESIGGEPEMTYPHIRQDLKAKMKSVVVKEFGGIDHLPEDIFALLKY